MIWSLILVSGMALAAPDKARGPEEYQLKKISSDWSDCIERSNLKDCKKKYDKKLLRDKFQMEEKYVDERKRVGRCNQSLTYQILDKEGDEYIQVWRYSYCKDPVQLSERLEFKIDPFLSLPKLVSYKAFPNPTPEIGVLAWTKKGFKVRFPEALTAERKPTGEYTVYTEQGPQHKIKIDKIYKVSLCEEQGRPRYLYQAFVNLPFKPKLPDEEVLKKNDGIFAFLVKDGLKIPSFNTPASKEPAVSARSPEGYEVLRLIRERNEYADCNAPNQTERQTFLDLVSPKWMWPLRCCGY